MPVVAGKVEQLFADSKTLDVSPWAGQCDLVFVDGSHAYSYVVSDSEKVLDGSSSCSISRGRTPRLSAVAPSGLRHASRWSLATLPAPELGIERAC